MTNDKNTILQRNNPFESSPDKFVRKKDNSQEFKLTKKLNTVIFRSRKQIIMMTIISALFFAGLKQSQTQFLFLFLTSSLRYISVSNPF